MIVNIISMESTYISKIILIVLIIAFCLSIMSMARRTYQKKWIFAYFIMFFLEFAQISRSHQLRDLIPQNYFFVFLIQSVFRYIGVCIKTYLRSNEAIFEETFGKKIIGNQLLCLAILFPYYMICKCFDGEKTMIWRGSFCFIVYDFIISFIRNLILSYFGPTDDESFKNVFQIELAVSTIIAYMHVKKIISIFTNYRVVIIMYISQTIQIIYSNVIEFTEFLKWYSGNLLINNELRLATTEEINANHSICAVCNLEIKGTARLLQCGHCMHPECANLLVRKNLICPVCGYNIVQGLNEGITEPEKKKDPLIPPNEIEMLIKEWGEIEDSLKGLQ